MDSNDFESVRDLETVPESLTEVFITTNDLSSRQHGLMQRAFQHAVDSGISKTVNLPNEANRADVHEAYMLALRDDELGSPIKGLTVYRDGSRNEQVLSTGEETKAALEDAKAKLEQAGVEVGEIDE
jgi:ribonucleoside-diphosphate reductase alpha chain